MSKKPNIIFILSDDQGAWAMGCAGNAEVRTPNHDRLAAIGIRFNNFFCASPVCSPARASILTGRMPSQHGVHDWLRAGNSTIEEDYRGELVEYLKGMTGYTEILAENGYTCGFSGKWHLGDSHHPQKGFTFWETHAKGGGPYYNAPMLCDGEPVEVEGYVTDIITDNAIRFLEQQKGSEQPFYLSVHYTAPHGPWNRDNHPIALWDDYYNNCAFESTPNVPPHPNCSRWCKVDDPERRRQNLSGYYAAITEMDRNIGRLIDWIEDHEMREETLIIFTSDNGMSMGHHGIFGKGNGTFPMNMYDTAVKVPMLISQPGTVSQNIVSEELLSHYDIMPTLLDYVGLNNPVAENLPGKSFVPVLTGKDFRGHERLVVYDEYGPVRMIRTREWKYVHRYPDGPHELYDLKNDPDENNNLFLTTRYQNRIDELKSRLESWFENYTDPAVDGRREAVLGGGQLGLCGDAAKGENVFVDH